MNKLFLLSLKITGVYLLLTTLLIYVFPSLIPGFKSCSGGMIFSTTCTSGFYIVAFLLNTPGLFISNLFGLQNISGEFITKFIMIACVPSLLLYIGIGNIIANSVRKTKSVDAHKK